MPATATITLHANLSTLPPVPLLLVSVRTTQRGRRHLDFAACDVGRGTPNADRGHDASALTRLRFDFASASHRDTLLDRKPIARPAKIMLRCHDADEHGTGGARRGIFLDAERGGPH